MSGSATSSAPETVLQASAGSDDPRAAIDGDNEPRGAVFVVDDEARVRSVVARSLDRAGLGVEQHASAEAAIDALEAGVEPDVILSDLHMDTLTGLDLLVEARERCPDVPFVIMTGQATVSSAVEAMKRGAYDYLTKPFDPPDEVVATVERALDLRRLVRRNRFLEQQVEISKRFEGVIGGSKPMQRVFSLIENVAPTDATVLVRGESGTGKELVARAIHERSSRSARSFVAVNCGALTETVLESELFGHVKGAFTGALSARRGLFEEAHGGTMLLDEVGELSSAMQVRLLRVLQEGEVRPVGASQSKKVDVRIIAATHRDLISEVDAGAFREDLYYRLNVFSIEVPALRERIDDLPLLVHHFVGKHAPRLGKQIDAIAPEALARLVRLPWRGNVRELENVIQRAILLSRSGVIDQQALPAAEGKSRPPHGALLTRSLAEAKAAFERRYIEQALAQAGGKVSEAARHAGVDRSNFRRLLKRYGISSSDG